MANELPSAIAVTVLTGFLGSGKTTLLNNLLEDPDLGQTAVLINEFGAVSIDHLLVEQVDEATVLLENGCICCSVRSDLVDAMRALIAKRADGRVPAFERLVIETTGLADPAPIVHTLMSDPLIAGQYRLDGLVATVDGVLGSQTLDAHAEAVKQAAIADRIVVTKCDLVQDLDSLETKLKDLNPAAVLIRSIHGDVPTRTIIDAGLFDRNFEPHVDRWLGDAKIKHHHDHGHGTGHQHGDGHGHTHDANAGHMHGSEHQPHGQTQDQGQGEQHSHDHGSNIRTFVLEAEGPIDFLSFQDWLETLLATQGANVLRIKGLLDVQDVDRPVAIHGVQHMFHPPAALPSWKGVERRSRIVFITRGLSEQAVRDTFTAHMPDQLIPTSK